MTTIGIIWIIVQVLIGYNLVLPFLVYLISLFKNDIKHNEVAAESDYAIIVTAYEQVTLIPAVVDSLLSLKYSNYLIYIVADKCDVSTLNFTDERVIVLRPETTLASNTRSHFYAIRNFKRPHERLTIIDSDNLVHPNYLLELDKCFADGFSAVQGIREAKNLNTTYACLDAARDIYYHYYDGELLFKVGSSATLAGSGMAFTTALYRECLEHLDVVGAGFDKVLQSEIVGRNYRIAFTPNAIVYDEKTTHSDQLVNQRARWINTWFKYFKFGFTLVAKGITTPSFNQFVFGLILLRPPLFIFLLLSVLFMLANLLISFTAVTVWASAFLIFIIGFYTALAKSQTDARIYRSLINIPRFMFFQVLSLLKSRTANKRSIATKHTYTGTIDQIVKADES